MLLQHLFESQGYHVKNHSVYGKILAFDGQTVLADHDKASMLADKFNGSLIKSMDGRRYIIKLSEAPPHEVREEEKQQGRTSADFDQELTNAKRFASMHYPKLDPEQAFDKWVQRSLKHSEEADRNQSLEIKNLVQQVSDLHADIDALKKEHAQMMGNGRIQKQ